MPAHFRSLTPDEIRALETGGSRAADWSKIRVADGFKASAVQRCRFSGDVDLGAFQTPVKLDGVEIPAGLIDSHIHQCRIGDNTLIQQTNLLAHYTVGAGVIVSNCGPITVEGESTFGHGVKVAVWNEGGGREVPMFDRLNASFAYLIACYRHQPRLIAALERIAVEYAASKKSSRGSIGDGACLTNTRTIRNVAIGAAATIEGAQKIENGTVCSKPEARTTIGSGVVAHDFMVGTGSTVDGGAILDRTFIGQGCKVGKQFSAENTAFFANGEAFHGESIALLAGPYSVTHHKGTLLIAGLLSFYNAGSGTNQSNHMYKLGPVHQGVLDRGSKTGSYGYLLWPARVGAFTVVIGKHFTHFDTHNLPFSYIYDEGGKSVLAPAANLFTVGTRRDGDKWPVRDRRSDPDQLDLIHFPVFSPLTIGPMMRGLADLQALYQSAPREQEYVQYNGIAIKRLLCRTAIKQYEIGIKRYLGSVLAARLESGAPLNPTSGVGTGEWVDWLGLMLPKSEADALCAAVERGEVKDLAAIETRMKRLHVSYAEWEWNWWCGAWKAWRGKPPAEMSREEQAKAIDEWQDAAVKLNAMTLNDAEKEFSAMTRTGFGLDGDQAVRDADFAAVRGTFEGNTFVADLQKESEEIKARAAKISAKLK
jgi:carbonic anhydrase/acetyltransferase-like protein (isoleucine patch superfamily)